MLFLENIHNGMQEKNLINFNLEVLFMAIMESINLSMEIYKKLKEVDEKVKNVEMRMLIADLGIELAEIKNSFADLMNENRELKDEISLLKLKKEEELIFKDGYYFKVNGEGPFCQGCYDKEKSRIRLTENPKHFDAFGKYKCPICNQHYK